MSKTVFDHLTEQLDGVVKGRRYIIAEIGKLKVSVEDLRGLVEQSSGGGSNIGAVVNDLKQFMQRTIATLGELKNNVSNLSGIVNSLSGQVQKLQQGGGVRAAPAPAPTPSYSSPAPTPSYSAPAPTPTPSYSSPAPTPSYSAPAPAAPAAAAPPATAGSAAASAFDRVLGAAKSGSASKDLGGMLDALRTSLSKANPLNPILFELSMEAGRLKSMGDKPLDASNLAGFEQKIVKWKSKS